MKLLIQAANIHSGGGKVLLTDLLRSLEKQNQQTIVFIDERFEYHVQNSSSLELIRIKPTVLHRLGAEIRIASWCRKYPNEIKLFFGNLPPLFARGKNIYLFFQNNNLLNSFAHFEFTALAPIRLQIEKFWLRLRINRVQKVIVQSESVLDSFKKDFPKKDVVIWPFAIKFDQQNTATLKPIHDFDFVYVSSGEPHKNHKNLLEAWVWLAQNNVYPSLALTVSQNYDQLSKDIEIIKNEWNLKVINVGKLTHEDVLKLYARSKMLIYPSLCEAFGLPLYEAAATKIPIVAAELDYVRELINPLESFDPNSPKSIGRAVLRAMHVVDKKRDILTAREFVANLLT